MNSGSNVTYQGMFNTLDANFDNLTSFDASFTNTNLLGTTTTELTPNQAVVTDGSSVLSTLEYTSADVPSTIVSRDVNGDVYVHDMHVDNDLIVHNDIILTANFAVSGVADPDKFDVYMPDGTTKLINADTSAGGVNINGQLTLNANTASELLQTDSSKNVISSNTLPNSCIAPNMQLTNATFYGTFDTYAPINFHMAGRTIDWSTYQPGGIWFDQYGNLNWANTSSHYWQISNSAGSIFKVNSGTIPGVIINTLTNNTKALQVNNSAGTAIFNIDTTTDYVAIDGYLGVNSGIQSFGNSLFNAQLTLGASNTANQLLLTDSSKNIVSSLSLPSGCDATNMTLTTPTISTPSISSATMTGTTNQQYEIIKPSVNGVCLTVEDTSNNIIFDVDTSIPKITMNSDVWIGGGNNHNKFRVIDNSSIPVFEVDTSTDTINLDGTIHTNLAPNDFVMTDASSNLITTASLPSGLTLNNVTLTGTTNISSATMTGTTNQQYEIIKPTSDGVCFTVEDTSNNIIFDVDTFAPKTTLNSNVWIGGANNYNKFRIMDNSSNIIVQVDTLSDIIQLIGTINTNLSPNDFVMTDGSSNLITTASLPSGLTLNNLTLTGTSTVKGPIDFSGVSGRTIDWSTNNTAGIYADQYGNFKWPSNGSYSWHVDNPSGQILTVNNGNSSNPGVTVNTPVNNTSAFKVTNSSGTTLFNVQTNTNIIKTNNNTLDGGAGQMGVTNNFDVYDSIGGNIMFEVTTGKNVATYNNTLDDSTGNMIISGTSKINYTSTPHTTQFTASNTSGILTGHLNISTSGYPITFTIPSTSWDVYLYTVSIVAVGLYPNTANNSTSYPQSILVGTNGSGVAYIQGSAPSIIQNNTGITTFSWNLSGNTLRIGCTANTGQAFNVVCKYEILYCGKETY